MTTLSNYKAHTFIRGSSTNYQLKLLFDFSISKGINLETYMRKNWHSTIWSILETILMGEKITGEVAEILKHWDKENRTAEEYAVKVMLAWLVEDYLLIQIQELPKINGKYAVRKGGTDSEREFKAANKCTSDPDLFLTSYKTGKNIQLEVVMDNGGYVAKTGELDTRMRMNGTGKYLDLQAKRTQTDIYAVFIVIFDVKKDDITFLRIDDKTEVIRIGPNPNWDDRPCTTLKVDRNLIRYPMTPNIAA